MSALILAAVLSASLRASEAAPLKLSDVQASVLAKNPSLQAAHRDADKAAAEAKVAAAWSSPQLSYEWMQLRWPDPVLSDAGRRRLELTQTFPLFGQASAMGHAADHAAMRAQAQARIEEARLAFEAKSAYWVAEQAGQMLKAQARTQGVLASLRKVSAQRSRFGRLDRMGQLMDAMLERELARDEAMGLHWGAEERAALFQLERLMGGEGEAVFPPLAEPDVAGLLAPTWDADELWGRAQTQNPELQEVMHHIEHAKAEKSAAQRQWLPMLMLEGGFEQSSGMDEATVKAGIDLPWLWFWGTQGKVEAAGLEQQHALAMYQDTRLMLREQCRMLASELYSSQAELKLSTERVLPAALRAMEAAESGYKSGDITAREAMDAVMGYWQANEDYAHRLWHVGTTLAAIDRLMAAPVMEMSHE